MNPLLPLTTISSTLESQAVDSAVNFLAANYNKTIGPVHESPDSSKLSDTYWLYSDNYLARLAFSTAATANARMYTIVNNISRTEAFYLHGQPAPPNQYQVLNSTLFAFNDTKPYVFGTVGVAVIKSTVSNQT